jgi:hypothetical protein
MLDNKTVKNKLLHYPAAFRGFCQEAVYGFQRNIYRLTEAEIDGTLISLPKERKRSNGAVAAEPMPSVVMQSHRKSEFVVPRIYLTSGVQRCG